jgi:signal transduction histidine kinase
LRLNGGEFAGLVRDVQEKSAASTTAAADMSVAVGRSSVAQVVAQQAAVAHIGQVALQETSLPSLLDEAWALVARVLETSFVSVTELSPDEQTLAIIAGVGWRPGVVGQLVLNGGSGSLAGYTISTGGPVIVHDLSAEKRFTVADSLVEHGVVSGISVRIGSADKPFGTLAAFAERAGHFTRDDANFLHAVANVLGAAVARLRVERELRTSRDQLAAIVSSIDEGITVQGPAGLIFANDEAAQLTGAESAEEMLAAGTALLDRFEIFDEHGQPMRADDLPGRRAMRGEEPPETIVGFRIKGTGEVRWSVLRAVALREANGAVANVTNIFREVTAERWDQEARAFMADAVAVLSSTLDVEEAASRLADLSVPRLADYCTVHLLQPDGSISSVALAHTNPERLEVARDLQRRRRIEPDAPNGVPKVIRDGAPERIDITPEMIDASPLPDEHKALLHKLEMRSYLSVPLRGREAPIGALSLMMAESGRTLGSREEQLAAELGTRAGIALENARLYQAAEARRSELDAVLAALAEAVLVFEARGNLRLANQAAMTTFAGRLPATLDELMARVTSDSSGGYEQSRGDTTDLAGIGDGEPVEVQFDRRGQWLELRRYSARTGGIESGAPTVVVLRDVTDVRAARAARDAFMGVISHELRTPITTIYGGSELLERGLDEEGRREVLADIRAESERLVRLVEDLLVMTRVERGIVETADEPILLQHLLGAVVQSSSARWPEARIMLHAADRLPAVRGDATYVEQVVRNLLTNAMRYGNGLESGVEIVTQQDDGFVAVRVLDNGSGFGGEDPERLFELFYRTTSARSVPGGAGIGLFVCRNLIEKMDGRVWATERPEGGAEFGFALPVLETDAAG